MKLRKNQSGFSPIIILLILLLILLALIGWWVSQNSKKSESPTPQPTAQSQKSETPAESVKYLEIKEWGLKMPLGDDITSAYYTVRAKTANDPAEYVEIFDSGFDNTTNQNGVKCKDAAFPLFVIGRAKQADVDQMAEQDKAGYKLLAVSSTYLFNGSEAHQSYPVCANLTPNGNFTEDKTITTLLSTKQKAITTAYAKIATL